MAPKKKFNNRKRVYVTYEMETYEALKNIAARKNITIPELVREYTEQGMNGNYQVQNIELITKIIRDVMNDIIDTKMMSMKKLFFEKLKQWS